MPTVTGDRCRKFVSWVALRAMKQQGCFVFKEDGDDCAHRKPPKKRKLVAARSAHSDCLRRYGFAAVWAYPVPKIPPLHWLLSRYSRRVPQPCPPLVSTGPATWPSSQTPARGALVVYSNSAFFCDQGRPEGISYEALQEFQRTLNRKFNTGNPDAWFGMSSSWF